MKRILFLFLIVVLFATAAFSQDIITKRTGEDIMAKIVEISLTEIKFKKFDNLDGPQYSILKSDVLMIRYANGTKDIFEQQQSVEYRQTVSNPITMTKGFGVYKFYQGERLLSMNELTNAMKVSEEAYMYIKSANALQALEFVLTYTGGFMIGWTLGKVITGGEPNWSLAGVGAGLCLVSIPVSASFGKKAKQAIDTYNSGLQTASFFEKKELNFLISGNGIGLTLNF